MLLCLFFATQAVLVNHFWTFAGDFFDTLSAKRMVPLFTVGLSLGGAAGGACALAVILLAPAEALIAVWAIGLLAAAALVHGARRHLQRWREVSALEEDETSVEGIRAAYRYLRRSPLGRWMVISALTMVLALFVAQYLYSDVLAATFPDEDQLATFLGIYLAVTNVVEAAVELWIAPALIRRFGVANANLVHPALSLLSFAGMAFDYRLPAAVGARVNRELLENALAAPVRTLVYNALPHRFRSRARAFLELIVIYSGMSLAGIVLLAADGLGPRELCVAGGGLALLYGLANLRVRHEYLRTLVAGLRQGRLDLRDLRAEIGPREVAELATLWTRLLRDEPNQPDEIVLELAPLLVAHGVEDPVRQALGHENPKVRAACLGALSASRQRSNPTPWLAGLSDPEPEVQLAALRALAPEIAVEEQLRERLRECVEHGTPPMRAEAARYLGDEGNSVLAEMAVAADVPAAVAGLSCLPAELAPLAVQRVADWEPSVRVASLECLARLGAVGQVEPECLADALALSDVRVRRATVSALAALPGAGGMRLLARALGDTSRPVRRAAALALAARGQEGFDAALPQLRAGAESKVAAAMRVLAESGEPRARDALCLEYSRRIRQAWETLLCAQGLPAGGGRELRFLRLAAQEACTRAVRLAFGALALLEDQSVVRSVERALRFDSGRARGDAFEVLSNLGDREASQWLVLLLERIPFEDKLDAVAKFARAPSGPEEARARAHEVAEIWLGPPGPHRAGASAAQAARETQMERLLSLRRVSLFSHLSLERLQAIERIMHEAEYVRGEVICRQGTPGEQLYLMIEGEVGIYRELGTPAEERLNTIAAGGYFGEIAVLDRSSRSASVVATTDVRVLVLEGSRLRELILEMPDIAFEIFQVLIARLRTAERRLEEGRPEKRGPEEH